MRPIEHNLSKKEQKSVLSKFKITKNARVIAEALKLSRHKVMSFLESEGLRTYSDKSYT